MSDAAPSSGPVDPAFAAPAAHPHELRVLLGAQAGSRLPLRDGEYTLGSSDDGSIILVGPRIAAVHATLRVDGDTVQVRPEAGRVLDAQGRELTQAQPLAAGMPVELDGVWITDDRSEAAWPDVRDLAAVAAATLDAAAGAPDAADAGVAPDPEAAEGRFGRVVALARRLPRPQRVGMALLVVAALTSITVGAAAWWHDSAAVDA